MLVSLRGASGANWPLVAARAPVILAVVMMSVVAGGPGAVADGTAHLDPDEDRHHCLHERRAKRRRGRRGAAAPGRQQACRDPQLDRCRHAADERRRERPRADHARNLRQSSEGERQHAGRARGRPGPGVTILQGSITASRYLAPDPISVLSGLALAPGPRRRLGRAWRGLSPRRLLCRVELSA